MLGKLDEVRALFRSVSGHPRNCELYEYERGATCELVSVGVSVSVDDVYRDPLAGVA